MINLRTVYYKMPPELRLMARKVYYFPFDLWARISGSRKAMEPPKGDIYIGSGDFLAQGRHHFHLLKELTQLKPAHAVLDVGSGIGRTAVPLTGYLDSGGVYEGFDVVEKGVKWCNENITRKFPNFRFQYIPLNNDLYNQATGSAQDFEFPYPAEKFDVVFLFSVFTHMRPAEVENYLFQIQRVLKPGGRCLATFFVYSDSEEQKIAEGNSFRFPYKEGDYRLMDRHVECANVAFREQYLHEAIENSGLILTQKVNGYWKDIRNKTELADFQDIFIMTK